jgi:3D-(3,5/4)-trihydroxycyclohexane-1,2-dione acylhydrolase (decyclizing)
MRTVRLTMAQALVRYLVAQRIATDGLELPLFAGVFAIFGHGNVTCLGEALEPVREQLPTWRGQNEQSMALAGIAYTKAKRRRQIMVAASSIGPGATNMVTAAAVAHANRLPILFLAGDFFANRLPDPVLQQVEHFSNPAISVNDAFRAVTRYWDRITRPEQILASLPHAVATMLDPGDCGPAFLSLCQDVQGEAYDYPTAFFEPIVHRIRRSRPDRAEVAGAAELLRNSKRPLLIAGGGVHYSLATRELAAFAERHNLPVTETIAGRAVLEHDHPRNVGPIGVSGSASANALAAETDLGLAVGTRLQDFSTGSWSAFRDPEFRLIALNAARFDAHKHRAVPVVGDALVGLEELSAALGDWRAPDAWSARGRQEYEAWNAVIDRHSGPSNAELPSYAQVIGAINRACAPSDLVVSAAGGLPGELMKLWRAKSVGSFDCEFGYSCMGYEIAGALGAKMADPDREVIAFLGDGSYLMMNSEIYSSVLTGHKLILVVCDNHGFAVIERLQTDQGGKSFNNMFSDCKTERFVPVDFVRHATSMGAIAEKVGSISDLEHAFARARSADRTTIIVVEVQAQQWTPGGTWWDIGVPEVSEREAVREARARLEKQRTGQRAGV